jgi:hypothetical protein
MSSVLLSSKKTIMSEKGGPFGHRYRQEPAPIDPGKPVLVPLKDLLNLPRAAIASVADCPVLFTNFYYENSFPFWSAFGEASRTTTILGIYRDGLRRSSSTLGDLSWIRLDDPYVEEAKFVIQYGVWAQAKYFEF